MAVSKDQVLAVLAKVPSPSGVALPDARVLSDVVVSDGKVFFSLTVDAAAVKSWEPVRKAAEDAVRAIPGVQAALVALTAERSGTSGGRPQQPPGQGPRVRPIRPIRFSPGFPGSTPLLRLRQERAASGNRRPQSIWRSACATLG